MFDILNIGTKYVGKLCATKHWFTLCFELAFSNCLDVLADTCLTLLNFR